VFVAYSGSNWVEKFSQGRSKVTADDRPGHPVEIATEATVQRMEELIQADRRITIDSVATALGCYRGLHSSKCMIAIQERIQELQRKLLEYPPYSPDLAPSDFHLFGPLNKHLGGKGFADDEEVQTEVWKRITQKSKDFYGAGFDALVKRWDKCISVGGGYVEK
jgi:hypothetical protein